MKPRFHVDPPLAAGIELTLPPGVARHAQVLRLQPGDPLTLFDGLGQDWPARVLAMGRSDVRVSVEMPLDVLRELPIAVTLAVGMPANERMDWLIEKATEMGVASVQPLLCERSVLRLHAERAERKRAHWQAVAVSAAEQCGRAVVPRVQDVRPLGAWLQSQRSLSMSARLMLSFGEGSRRLSDILRSPGAMPATGGVCFLSGPEGGLSDSEEAVAATAGFERASLGPRVLRADTAPLAALASVAALME